MTPEGRTRTCAFGGLNLPLPYVGENIEKALSRAKDRVLKAARPTTGSFPVNSLRRELCTAMCLDVVYSPRFTEAPPRTSYKNSKLPRPKLLEISPVWKTAPVGAYRKANRISSLLHLLVTYGWRVPTKKIVRLLTRLSINIWSMTLGHFYGLCRKIVSVVLANIQIKNPEPTLRFGALSVKPIFRIENFLKPRRTKAALRRYDVNRLPNDIGLAVYLLNRIILLRRKATSG